MISALSLGKGSALKSCCCQKPRNGAKPEPAATKQDNNLKHVRIPGYLVY